MYRSRWFVLSNYPSPGRFYTRTHNHADGWFVWRTKNHLPRLSRLFTCLWYLPLRVVLKEDANGLSDDLINILNLLTLALARFFSHFSELTWNSKKYVAILRRVTCRELKVFCKRLMSWNRRPVICPEHESIFPFQTTSMCAKNMVCCFSNSVEMYLSRRSLWKKTSKLAAPRASTGSKITFFSTRSRFWWKWLNIARLSRTRADNRIWRRSGVSGLF